MTLAQWIALLTGISGAIGSVLAILHSLQTRRAVNRRKP